MLCSSLLPCSLSVHVTNARKWVILVQFVWWNSMLSKDLWRTVFCFEVVMFSCKETRLQTKQTAVCFYSPLLEVFNSMCQNTSSHTFHFQIQNITLHACYEMFDAKHLYKYSRSNKHFWYSEHDSIHVLWSCQLCHNIIYQTMLTSKTVRPHWVGWLY